MSDRALLICGTVAGPAFTIVYLLEGARRAHYQPVRHPVSSLALGEAGWIQTVNFIVAGLLSLASAVGLWQAGPSRAGALLIGAWAIGLLCAGAFRTDPVSGYPPDTPDLPQQPTRAGTLHDLLSLGGFVALTAACIVYAWSSSAGWAIYSIASGVLFAVAMAVSSAAFSQKKPLVTIGGLIQRVAVTIGWTWLTILTLRILHT